VSAGVGLLSQSSTSFTADGKSVLASPLFDAVSLNAAGTSDDVQINDVQINVATGQRSLISAGLDYEESVSYSPNNSGSSSAARMRVVAPDSSFPKMERSELFGTNVATALVSEIVHHRYSLEHREFEPITMI
jgi:hypothetical protein